MSGLLDGLSEAERCRVRRRRPPEWLEPMLATRTDARFDDPGWIFERKLDGERCLAFVGADGPRLYSRNRQPLDDSYPELVEALADQAAGRLVLDGEIVAFEHGVTSFQRLQARMQLDDPAAARDTGVAVFLYLFDVLQVGEHDVEAVTQRARKSLLRRAVEWRDPLRFTPHRNRDGTAYWSDACERGWEGVIAKRADAAYRHARSRDWLKFKCVNRQELVVGGFTEPEGERIGLGALLVGYHRDGRLRYAGKVGTGFDDDTLRDLRSRLERLERRTCPFGDGDPPASGGGVHWTRPELVAEIGFTEWTAAGRLRHPRFLGLRRDKDPAEVVRE